jgi:hypothetical protein
MHERTDGVVVGARGAADQVVAGVGDAVWGGGVTLARIGARLGTDLVAAGGGGVADEALVARVIIIAKVGVGLGARHRGDRGEARDDEEGVKSPHADRFR